MKNVSLSLQVQSNNITRSSNGQSKTQGSSRWIGGSHYKKMGVQPWEAMESLLTFEEFIGFLKGNMIKYAMRQGLKDPHDADKFRHYRQKYLEMLIPKPLD
ncbi:MAG: DUF3310 domain-containing protein [Betaproteobacteria bacterium]|nr:DUF3310 domain-containing protein [Betaproteobacteria bacterium]